MTNRQAKLVEIIKADAATIGKTKTKARILEEAGYTPRSARSHQARILGSKEIQQSLQAAGITKHKVFAGLAEGLEATTLYGKEALEHPDYSVRHKYIMTSLQLYGYGVSSKGNINIQADNIGIMFGNGKSAVEKGVHAIGNENMLETE